MTVINKKYIIYHDNKRGETRAELFDVKKMHAKRWEEIKEDKVLVSAGYICGSSKGVLCNSGSESLGLEPNEYDQKFFETRFVRQR